MAKMGGKREMHTEFQCTNLQRGYNLDDLSVDGRIVLKYTLIEEKSWSESIRFRTRSSKLFL